MPYNSNIDSECTRSGNGYPNIKVHCTGCAFYHTIQLYLRPRLIRPLVKSKRRKPLNGNIFTIKTSGDGNDRVSNESIELKGRRGGRGKEKRDGAWTRATLLGVVKSHVEYELEMPSRDSRSCPVISEPELV